MIHRTRLSRNEEETSYIHVVYIDTVASYLIVLITADIIMHV